MLYVCAHGTGQHHGFEIAAATREFRNVVAVRHAGHVLLNDRTFVEITRHVVSGRTDDLHTTIVCLAVRVGADERREERMVDVDHLPVPLVGEPRRQHQHVTGENDEVEIQGVEEVRNLLLLFGASRLFVASVGEADVFVAVPEGLNQLTTVVVIGDNGLDVEAEVAVTRAGEQIGQAMDRLRHEDCCARTPRHLVEGIGHGVLVGHGAERRVEEIQVALAGVSELHPLEEGPVVVIGVLFGMDDVAAVHGHPTRHLGHDPRCVGAGNEEDGCFHKVETMGIEPTTSCLQSRRSTN